jgi:hypothetical protein
LRRATKATTRAPRPRAPHAGVPPGPAPQHAATPRC